MSVSAWAILRECFPLSVLRHIDWIYPVVVGSIYYPYIKIKFSDCSGEQSLTHSEAFFAIHNYLRSKASKEAKRLRGYVKKNQSLVLSMDLKEEVADEFQGAKVWWALEKTIAMQHLTHPPVPCERWHYKLTFHKTHRALIVGPYIKHVMKEGNATKMGNRERKLYTNNGARWSHVMFEHPATFKTLAMDPVMKQEIMDDLMAFSKAEEFYKSTGRAWKRGYLLYGPPGIGKSTMIAAMANLLGYNLYDLELTSVKNNIELRKLLLETSNKSVIMIEDIDCSFDLTGQRSKKNDKVIEKEDTGDGKEKEANILSHVTLSGLLNFIDGLWSAYKGERLIVIFTTNYVEKLDAALTRKGRLDKHIELSYCTFEAYKVLARNYLKLESHHLFPAICELLGETNVVPADVAEHLMPKTLSRNVDLCLQNLIQALKKEKENGKLIAEEERKDGNNQLKRKCLTSTQDHLIEDKKRAKN
ncbi:AAA-ATPase At3g28510-like [Pyrus communis]|uniref:AAA-ATPase At3g28510-like n=1 Tax=Pyrus communis TaxID=23211 RepID=UPI0035BF24BF